MTGNILLEFARFSNPIYDQGKLTHLYYLLREVLTKPVYGELVELGSHEGKTAAFIQAVAHDCGQFRRLLHVFDSFQGFPEWHDKDSGGITINAPGNLASSPDSVLQEFTIRALPAPIIHAGWLKDTIDELPSVIAFAHLDTDLYEPIKLSLEQVYPRMAIGGVVLIDDYGWQHTPGVTYAVDEFLADKPESIELLFGAGAGFFRKQ